MKTRFLTLITALAFMGFSVSDLAARPEKCDPWPECKDDGGGSGETSATYTAALTVGGFRFDAVDVTPNNRGTGFTSTLPLDMGRPVTTAPPAGQIGWESLDDEAWDEVFLACHDVLGGVQITGVAVGSDWGITQGGKRNSDTAHNIRITFRDVVADGFPEVDIDFALITWNEYDRSAFLPAVGQTSIYSLDTAKIYGSDIGNQLGCNSGEFTMLKPVKLEISRIE